MPLKVAILHQGFIPPYRVRFYELLNQLPGTEYVVFHGAPPSESGSRAADGPFAFANRWVTNREIHIGRWNVIYQPALWAVLTGGYHAVVLGHEIKFISNLLLALLCKLRGTPVLYWGIGYHIKFALGLKGEAKGWATQTASVLKDILARLADGYLVYTARGAEKLAAIGFPKDRIHILQNTIDMTQQIQLHSVLSEVDPADVRRELGLRVDSVVFLFVGRLIEIKRVEILIEAIRRINAQDGGNLFVELLVIGGGPLEGELRQMAADIPGIRFLGEIQDQRRVALCMKVAAAVVIPGNVGLAANHALAQGRPMITRKHDLHGPELGYIVHGENGLIVEGGIEAFAEALAGFAASPERQRHLANGALRSRDALRMETMVERFDSAVRAALARRRGEVLAVVEPPSTGHD